MPTLIRIPRNNGRFGGTVSAGLNGRIFRIPVGVEYLASDDEVAALAASAIPTTCPQVPAGQVLFPASVYGSRVVIGVNGVISYIPTGIPVQLSYEQALVVQANGMWFMGSPLPAGWLGIDGLGALGIEGLGVLGVSS